MGYLDYRHEQVFSTGGGGVELGEYERHSVGVDSALELAAHLANNKTVNHGRASRICR